MKSETVVFVVDDDHGIRRALCRLLKSAGYQCRCLASAAQFLDAYDSATPGCLILDVKMERMSGLELQTELSDRGIIIPIIFISGYAEVPKVVQAMKVGAIDFLEKPFRDELLLHRVQQAIEQDRQLRSKEDETGAIRLRLELLTPREGEVMGLLVVGRTVKQIGAELDISPKTVDIHRARVLKKMQVDNVVELTQLVNRIGVSSAQ